MPELPEVETVVRDLNKKVKNARIIAVWSDTPKQIRDFAAPGKRLTDIDRSIALKNLEKFKKDIIGSTINSAKRRGKNILIYLRGEKVMLVHQKMTGHLLIGRWKFERGRVVAIEPRAVVSDPYNGFIHLVLTLEDGRMLALSDLRKFAKVILGSAEQIENLTELKNLGPDALDPGFSFGIFKDRVKKKGPTIKQVLMNQEVIAGIGNIYSDDILWRAKVHPQCRPKTLSNSELEKIYESMREVLAKAVKLRGTSTSDFRDTAGREGGYTEYRLVYQREGEPCGRCQNTIKRITVGGRSAHFCPRCQKQPNTSS